MKTIFRILIIGGVLLGTRAIPAFGVVVPSTVLEQEYLSSGTSRSPVTGSTVAAPHEATVEKLKEDEQRLSEILKDLQEESNKLKALNEKSKEKPALH